MTDAKLKGTVQGKAARKYPDYTYRAPVEQSVNIWTLDPGRWYPTEEFPRDVLGINPVPRLQVIELADYVVQVDEVNKKTGACCVRVWVIPNQYTVACKPLLALEFQAALEIVINHRNEMLEFALKRVFH